MSISILIPAYKPTWFKECLESVLNQDYPIDEIIVSDDSPTDEISEIIKRFDDKRIKYHRNETPLGLVSNHFNLVKLSSSTWLKFLDDDDTLFPDAVSKLMRLVERHENVTIAFGSNRSFRDGGYSKDVIHDLPEFMDGTKYFIKMYPENPITLFARTLIKRSIMEGIDASSFSRHLISLDELVSLRALLKGNVAYEKSVICAHRLHPEGYSRTLSLDVLCDDVEYVMNPYRHALQDGNIPRSELEAWKALMVKKNARGTITKLISKHEYGNIKKYWLFLYKTQRGIAIKALFSPRIIIKFVKSLFKRSQP